MSLHIGRLSQDVHHSYLEHLFQRYGHCTVNLKDGYGFAVYDSKDDAAQAMRAMRGKYVCGERITVNWSKQQPRFSHSLRRSSRFVESSRGRSYIDAKNHPAHHDQSHNPDVVPKKKSDKVAEVANHAAENITDDPGEVKRDEGGTVDEDPGELKRDEDGTVDEDSGKVKRFEGGTIDEHDRWAETGKETPGRDGDDFDHYEPYHGYDRQEETENEIKASSYDSHEHRRFSEKWQESSDKLLDIGHDKSRSPPACYSCGVAGHIARNCPEGIDDKFRARTDRLNFQEKWKLRQRRFGSPSRRRSEFHVHPMDQAHHRVRDGRKIFSERNRRVHRLSNVPQESRGHADCGGNVPQTTKEARKRSRSKRSHGSSLSSEPPRYSHQDNVKASHSNNTSSDSKSRSPRPHSRVRVRSPLHSAQSSSKSSQPTQREGSRSNANHPVLFSVSTSPQHKCSPDVENNNLDDLMNFPLEDNLDMRAKSEVKHVEDNKLEGYGSAVNSEVPFTSFNINTLSNGKLLVPDKDSNVPGYTGVNLINGNDNIATNGEQGQIANFQDTLSLKSKQDVLAKNGRSKSLKLTTNEVISALKHYGMEAQQVDSSDQPVEKYFGAARLWPWEIIYYRRLKKGSISTENYAKRLEQNKEFGIVDQYVRSSSGWWESH